MKASVLMPSRERVDMARESIQSLGEGDFEVLMFIDDDDSQLDGYKKLTKEFKNVKLIIKPRLTYYRFHEMINELCKHAKGDWLLLWNDDAFFQQPWIDRLDKYDHNKVNVTRWGFTSNNLNLFPAISRKMYELQGYYSMSPHCDSWAMDMSKLLNCERWITDVHIEHRRDYQALNDSTKQHSVEAYKTTVPQHNSPEVQAEFHKAAERLRDHV